MDPFSYVANADTQVIADLYEAYKQDPNSVDSSWRDFFKGFDFSQTWLGEGSPVGTVSTDSGHVQKEMAVISLIKAFRSRGHLLSKTNPVRARKDRKPRLDLADYALSDADLAASKYVWWSVSIPIRIFTVTGIPKGFAAFTAASTMDAKSLRL